MPRHPRSLRPLLVLVPLLLGACSYDPWQKPGTWQPTAANDQNLKEMLAIPADAVRGEQATGARAAAAAAPVGALLSGTTPSLDGAASGLAGAGSGGGNGGGMGAGAAAGASY